MAVLRTEVIPLGDYESMVIGTVLSLAAIASSVGATFPLYVHTAKQTTTTVVQALVEKVRDRG